jgi:probable rRNA maturation factor
MIEINNRTDFDLPLKELKKLVAAIYSGEKDISIAFIDSSRISILNKKYRDKEEPTDVLSFPGDLFLGEILIAPEVVKRQATEANIDFNTQIRRVLVHGVLHLLGYDHKNKEDKEKMRSKEEEFLKKGLTS